MGAYKRFSDAKGYVSTKLLDRIYSTINGNAVKSSSIKTTFNIEKSSMDQFISDNVNWEPHNTETDDYVFRKYAIDTTKDHYRLVCDKIIQTLCALDNDAIKNNETAKTLKVN